MNSLPGQVSGAAQQGAWRRGTKWSSPSCVTAYIPSAESTFRLRVRVDRVVGLTVRGGG